MTGSHISGFLDDETLFGEGVVANSGGAGTAKEFPLNKFHPRNLKHMHQVNVVFHVSAMAKGDSDYDVQVQVADDSGFTQNVTTVATQRLASSTGPYVIPLDLATVWKLAPNATHIRLNVVLTLDTTGPNPTLTYTAWITKS